MEDGTAVEVGTTGRRGVVGAMTGIGVNKAHTRAIAQLAGKGSKISAKKFEAAVRGSPNLTELIIRHKDTLLIQAQSGAACNSLHTVEARLARWILQCRDLIESDEINLTQAFIAEMLGVQRTTVTLVAQSLQKDGLIQYRRGRIKIVNTGGLEKKSCECYRTIRDRIAEVFNN
jgi:DNA-binding MarR family transcriptional regulator